MKKHIVFIASLMSATAVALSGCQIKTVDNSAYVGMADAYDYSGMRDNDKVFNAEEEKENIDRGVYKDSIKDEVMANAVTEAPTEPESETSTEETEPFRVVGNHMSDTKVENKDGSSISKNNNSSKNNNNSSNKNNSSTTETTAAPKKNNTSSIDTNVKSDTTDSSKNTDKTDTNDSPEQRKNPASMVINGSKYNVYITIEGYYRGNKALRRLNTYNSTHAVEYNMDIPSGYEPVIVQFTVSASDTIPNKNNTLIPEIRARDGSGQAFADVPTTVTVLRMGDYNDKSSSTKSYDAVFEMPADKNDFQLLFGASNGNTYRFKSTLLDSSTED